MDFNRWQLGLRYRLLEGQHKTRQRCYGLDFGKISVRCSQFAMAHVSLCDHSASDKAPYVADGVNTSAPDHPYARLPQDAAAVMRCTACVRGRAGQKHCHAYARLRMSRPRPPGPAPPPARAPPGIHSRLLECGMLGLASLASRAPRADAQESRSLAAAEGHRGAGAVASGRERGMARASPPLAP